MFGRKTKEDDQFIPPAHVCRPPKSRLWGNGPDRTPEDTDKCPAGTRWICDCGRAWFVDGDFLNLWRRCPADDVAELLT